MNDKETRVVSKMNETALFLKAIKEVNRMKKAFLILLVVVICFSMAGCQQPEKQNSDNSDEIQIENIAPTKPQKTEPQETEPVREATSTPLLYRVSDEEGNEIWLFGSIHVGIEDYYPLPDYVMDAFADSEALAVEFDIVDFERRLGAQMKALQALIYTDGTTIQDHIPADLYEKALAIVKENKLYNKAFEMYVPMMWVSLIENILMELAEVDTSLGVDRYMIELAYECDKPVLDVESAEFQYGMMAGFSEELQGYLLEQSVSSFDAPEEYIAEIEEMVVLWSLGNEEEFAAVVSKQPEFSTAEEAALYEEYNNAMIYERNRNMTAYAVEALENGEELFICVGAAHVVGQGALAENLRELGYTVEIVR